MTNGINAGTAAAQPLPAPQPAVGTQPSSHEEHERFAPLAGRSAVPFLTRGTWVLIGLAAAGLAVLAVRLIWGIGAVTNLDNQYPWGLWIGIDVATGVALAAGGFTTSFIAHVLHNQKYSVLVRPALLTAMLGYTFVALGVCVDLGRYYNIWHVLMPSMWQGNSALFEVGMCVCIYLMVLYIEFLPLICERFIGKISLPGPLAGLNGIFDRLLRFLDAGLHRTMTFFIIMGVVLSCAHQSSLGTLMVIAPTKLHALWHTPVLPLLFLLSAFAVGLSMVVFESLLASRSFQRPFEMSILSPFARIIPFLLTIYFGAKLIDLVNRDAIQFVFKPSLQMMVFWNEIIIGIFLPMAIILTHKLRRQPVWLFTAAAMVIFGTALNRLNVFIIGYEPPFSSGPYIPAIPEIMLTVGFISILVLIYRAWVFIFPVLPEEEEGHGHA